MADREIVCHSLSTPNQSSLMELSLLGLSRLFSLSVQLAGYELHKKQSDSLRKTQKCNIYI